MRRPAVFLAFSLAAATPAEALRLPDGFFPESVASSRDGPLNVGSAVEGAILCARPPLPVADLTEIPLPPRYAYPNGIARGSDGTFYVGSITSGRILSRRPGETWKSMFAGSDTIYAGTSLRLDEARALLWGASPDFLPGRQARPHRIFALDLSTGEVRLTLELPDRGFGNDIALGPDGAVFVTDSRNGRVLRLRPGTRVFEVLVEDDRLRGADGIGVAGIALGPDGRFVLGNYGSGRLYVLENIDAGEPRLRLIALPRAIENPDGLAFAPDGALLVIEGAAASGDGRLLRVPDPVALGPRRIETILTSLDSPVNLTVASDSRVWVSEARVRHRLNPETVGDVPNRFRLLQLQLNREASR